jgi:7-cyano-7-deazaguanine synthase in queuosine biosynthesis
MPGLVARVAETVSLLAASLTLEADYNDEGPASWAPYRCLVWNEAAAYLADEPYIRLVVVGTRRMRRFECSEAFVPSCLG